MKFEKQLRNQFYYSSVHVQSPWGNWHIWIDTQTTFLFHWGLGTMLYQFCDPLNLYYMYLMTSFKAFLLATLLFDMESIVVVLYSSSLWVWSHCCFPHWEFIYYLDSLTASLTLSLSLSLSHSHSLPFLLIPPPTLNWLLSTPISKSLLKCRGGLTLSWKITYKCPLNTSDLTSCHSWEFCSHIQIVCSIGSSEEV